MSSPPAEGVRVHWHELPPDVRAAIERICGAPVTSAQTQPGGFSPGVAARLVCADGGRHFVKAVSAEANPDSPRLHRREAEILTALNRPDRTAALPVPGIRGYTEVGPWIALVLQDIDGSQPALPWQAGQLDQVLAALDRLAGALTPAPIGATAISDYLAEDFCGWRTLAGEAGEAGEAGDAGEVGEAAAHRLDPWSRKHLTELAELEASWPEFASGDTLLHADLRADNLLCTADGVIVVDWPHACLGAAFVDPVLLAPSVTMQGGPPPAELLARSRAGSAAPAQAVAAVVCALAGYVTERSLRPPAPGLPTLRAFQSAQAEVARRWLSELLER